MSTVIMGGMVCSAPCWLFFGLSLFFSECPVSRFQSWMLSHASVFCDFLVYDPKLCCWHWVLACLPLFLFAQCVYTPFLPSVNSFPFMCFVQVTRCRAVHCSFCLCVLVRWGVREVNCLLVVFLLCCIDKLACGFSVSLEGVLLFDAVYRWLCK